MSIIIPIITIWALLIIIGFSCFIIVNRQLKLLLFGTIIVAISYFAIKSNDDMTAIFASMVDFSGNKVEI